MDQFYHAISAPNVVQKVEKSKIDISFIGLPKSLVVSKKDEPTQLTCLDSLHLHGQATAVYASTPQRGLKISYLAKVKQQEV